MLPSHFVVRNLQEEQGDGLPKSGEVGFRRLLRDWLEVIDRCREFATISSEVILRRQRWRGRRLKDAEALVLSD